MASINKTVILNKLLSTKWTNIRFMSTQINVQEVRIPTPLGLLAGKWWGPTDKRPIVAFHGWQDNCGTFDTLIPLLPKHIPYLALDCPGHGFSYKLPAGVPYHNADIAIMIKELIKYFGWHKLTLMGHSLGAILSYTYGFLFPKDIDFVICIDGLHPLVNPQRIKRVVRSIEEFIKYDALQRSNIEPPSYTIEEMMKRLHLATRKSIALEATKYILYRNIAPSKTYPGKFYFNRDARLKVGPLSNEDPIGIKNAAAHVNFPIFISKAKESPFFGNETMFKEVHAVLEKSSPDCQFHDIPGEHHVHLNQPENIAGLITKFIEKHDKGDRKHSGFKDEIVYKDPLGEHEKVKAALQL
ncbi:epoxide hydrolase [Holotrichia oblita]|uniref:Epoxide hydrolase n=1 Tax=Holotrichia oblita TaxID=644536 RepID=A0ACB9T0V7_HOLOL|nr:epoxide hydrolase [Holotrichia oblita]